MLRNQTFTFFDYMDPSLRIILTDFYENFDGTIPLTSNLSFSVSNNFENIVNTIHLGFSLNGWRDTKAACYTPCVASFLFGNSVLVTLIDNAGQNDDIWKSYDRNITIGLYGDGEKLKIIKNYLIKNIEIRKVPIVNWDFITPKKEKASRVVTLDEPKPIHKSFYPWIEDGVEQFYEKYLASESSILVLLGETGTAKTSFIRNFIKFSGLDTVFTYDEELLTTDSFFVDFITDTNQLLVMEDADLVLGNREHEGNRVMSKFLNVGDGLASLKKKKIIFTANIMQSDRIDEALLRPGRCFDCLTFRRLTYKESCAAAESASLPIPVDNGKGYTLAELFASNIVQKNKMGFVITKA